MNIEAIKKAALLDYPNEMCGFILSDDSFVHCINTSDDASKSFKISASEYARHIGNIKFIVHTHIVGRTARIYDPRTPSLSDINSQKETNVPWLIFSCDGDDISDHLQIPRVPNKNYFDRPFIWFINDCYSIVQDYYRFELGIILEDHKTDKPFSDVSQLNEIFLEHIEGYGFKQFNTIDDLKNGDILLLDNMGFKKNHLGIYHDGMVIHQDQLSVKEPFEHFIGRINAVLKYVN